MSNPLFNFFSSAKLKEKEKEKDKDMETDKEKEKDKEKSADTSTSQSSSTSSGTAWWRTAFHMREIRVKEYPSIAYSGPSHIALPTPLSSISAFSVDELIDRIKGAVFGQCLGDALGLHTEFLSKARSYELYGHGNLPFGEPIRGWAGGDWSDDTDQAVLLLDMMLANGGAVNEKDFAARLWYWVENGFSELGDTYGNGCGGVVSAATRHPRFLDDPHTAAREVYERSGGWAAANGAVMRTSVLGLPNFHDLNKVVEQTRRMSTCTHFDPRCTASSILCTTAIALLLQGRYDPADPASVEKVIDEAFQLATKELRRCAEVETAQNKQKRKEVLRKQREMEVKMKEHESERKKKRSEKQRQKQEKKLKKKPQEQHAENAGDEEQGTEQPAHKDSEEDGDSEGWSDEDFMEARLDKSTKLPEDALDSDDDAYALNEDGKREKISERFNRWMRDLKSHCSVSQVEQLHLDESRKIGFTLKCIGSGVWSLRQNDFKRAMVRLVLEGGDADTNAAVGGAMLGAKLGYSKLPKEWLRLMPYRDWLDKRLERLLGYMGLRTPEPGVSLAQVTLTQPNTTPAEPESSAAAVSSPPSANAELNSSTASSSSLTASAESHVGSNSLSSTSK